MSAEFKHNNQRGWYAEADPQDIDDYPINWSDWLRVNNFDVIVDSIWSVPQGVTVGTQAFLGGSTVIQLGPCAPGTYIIMNHVKTVGTPFASGLPGMAREKDQSFTLVVRDDL